MKRQHDHSSDWWGWILLEGYVRNSPPWYIKKIKGWKHRKCRAYRHPKYDAYFCKEHNKWLEPKCGEQSCGFCAVRPTLPLRYRKEEV